MTVGAPLAPPALEQDFHGTGLLSQAADSTPSTHVRWPGITSSPHTTSPVSNSVSVCADWFRSSADLVRSCALVCGYPCNAALSSLARSLVVRTMCTLGVHTVHGVFAPQARCGVVDRENGAPEDAVCADVRSDADSITIVARDAKEVTRCHCLFRQAKD